MMIHDPKWPRSRDSMSCFKFKPLQTSSKRKGQKWRTTPVRNFIKLMFMRTLSDWLTNHRANQNPGHRKWTWCNIEIELKRIGKDFDWNFTKHRRGVVWWHTKDFKIFYRRVFQRYGEILWYRFEVWTSQIGYKSRNVGFCQEKGKNVCDGT